MAKKSWQSYGMTVPEQNDRSQSYGEAGEFESGGFQTAQSLYTIQVYSNTGKDHKTKGEANKLGAKNAIFHEEGVKYSDGCQFIRDAANRVRFQSGGQ
ncbi:hypothetical protein M6D81_21085 [Paenibacillus sp. J5C_2022]|nr:hypothetical protein [Paenibacillus sp. J5C2022]